MNARVRIMEDSDTHAEDLEDSDTHVVIVRVRITDFTDSRIRMINTRLNDIDVRWRIDAFYAMQENPVNNDIM